MEPRVEFPLEDASRNPLPALALFEEIPLVFPVVDCREVLLPFPELFPEAHARDNDDPFPLLALFPDRDDVEMFAEELFPDVDCLEELPLPLFPVENTIRPVLGTCVHNHNRLF